MATYLEVLCDFTNKPLERELPDQKLGRLLVPPNLTEGDSTGAETMRLLDTTSGGLWQNNAKEAKTLGIITPNCRR